MCLTFHTALTVVILCGAGTSAVEAQVLENMRTGVQRVVRRWPDASHGAETSSSRIISTGQLNLKPVVKFPVFLFASIYSVYPHTRPEQPRSEW